MSRPGYTPNALIELGRHLFHISRDLPMDAPSYPILSETAITMLKQGVSQMLTNRVGPCRDANA